MRVTTVERSRVRESQHLNECLLNTVRLDTLSRDIQPYLESWIVAFRGFRLSPPYFTCSRASLRAFSRLFSLARLSFHTVRIPLMFRNHTKATGKRMTGIATTSATINSHCIFFTPLFLFPLLAYHPGTKTSFRRDTYFGLPKTHKLLCIHPSFYTY
jgi:hypothetical protein